MRAVILENFGGVENLRLVEDFPKPQIKEDEVLIRVRSGQSLQALRHYRS